MIESTRICVGRRSRRSLCRFAIVLAVGPAVLSAPRVRAEDEVSRRGSTVNIRGDVVEVSRTAVVVRGRTNKKDHPIAANEIERIRWDGEKAQLTQVRLEERNGRYDKAIAGYQAARNDAATENLRTDLEFLIARTTAEKALAEDDKFDDAIALLEKFRTAHSNSFRYFESLRLLARLYMEKHDVDKATATLKLMSEAPWNDYKMEADLLQAEASVAQNQLDAALHSLDNVIRVTPKTPFETAQHYEALLTKASCLEKQAKFQEASEVLAGILDEAAEDDIKTLAKTCLRLGECYQAAGRTKEAILAYLRVDILFPKEKASHAEALYQLSRLFVQDGKPDKAADAAARLQQTYPRSPWTAKLSVGTK
jgi:tetratricopeptide (TPR) repeat protein